MSEDCKKGRKRLVLVAVIGWAGLIAACVQGAYLLRDYDVLFARTFDSALTEAEIAAQSRIVLAPDLLESRLHSLLDQGDLDTVESYLVLAEEQGVAISAQLRERIDRANSPWSRWPQLAGASVTGFVTGEGDSAAHIGGALASEMMVVGDLRDLGEQGLNYARGEPVDSLIVGLSGLGVALSAGTIVSLGATGPVKFGTATAKVMARSGRLSSKLSAELGTLASRALPPKHIEGAVREAGQALAKAGRGEASAKAAGREAAAAITRAGDPLAWKKLAHSGRDFGRIGEAVGPLATMRLARHAETTADLANLGRVSPMLGKRALAFEHALGKGVLQLTKTSIKWTASLLLQLAGFFSGLFASVASWAAARGLRGIALATIAR